MRSAVVLLALVAVAQAAAAAAAAAAPAPCELKPLGGPARDEVFIFHNDNTAWKSYDWTRATTVVLQGEQWQPELYCTAHANGVRVVLGTGAIDAAQLGNETYVAAFVSSQAAAVREHGLDGVCLDMEAPVDAARAPLLTALVARVREALPAPLYQVTFDAAWSPACIDGRCYDYAGMARHTDFLFVMCYDTQSQIFPPRACRAYANSPLPWCEQGLRQFMAEGVPARQLVWGAPWYGYYYPCEGAANATGDASCPVREVPFRGAPCSDAAGHEIPYGDVLALLASPGASPVAWDGWAQSPYADLNNGTHHAQLRFDSPRSLKLKFARARALGLRGVGVWNGDQGQGQPELWEAFDAFLHAPPPPA